MARGIAARSPQPFHNNSSAARRQIVRDVQNLRAAHVIGERGDATELMLTKEQQIEAGMKIARELVRQRRARGISPQGTLFEGETAS